MCADTANTPDYRSTVYLPETEFPMRAGLPMREPEWLARWERLGIYDALRAKRQRQRPRVRRVRLMCSTMALPMRTAICTSAMR